jgi:drug/metabolite transporter (DMT)-like permease
VLSLMAMVINAFLRLRWLVEPTLQQSNRDWSGISSAAQVLIAAIPIVSVSVLAVLSFFVILWDYRKQQRMIEKGLTPKPRNIDDRLLLIGIVAFFVGVGLLVFFALKTGLSNSLLGGIIPTASGMGIITYYILIYSLKKKREREKNNRQ